ncbi:vitamin B12-dependent ribonucleotide reductase [Spiroplasma eriocheiris]|uniref:Vitamin B12-dependent ribonucleotide reductase n=1 Tax=Spiroplasma eriocheiris TaxID=315358 RepID=A0A0H3XKK8_9MOLU|nr:vitamin B12-dependent ribonucleotide reductase [Spiroplasma eriocheiris]AHF57502.1 ribonucleotide-diphosphate reductase subunit alpha [Spiroplasma eriocheiris CCTCC M 207170]AKM53959.1 ribonucleotide-diphosphate reductase subunit alpha [Spiroplasma eriocheiris]
MYSKELVASLNADIRAYFPHIKEIEPDYHMTFDGVSRMVVLDRYAQKDNGLKTLKNNDLVITVIKDDGWFPARGFGHIVKVDREAGTCDIKVEEDYVNSIDPNLLVGSEKDIIRKNLNTVEKPLEIYYEQIAWRVAKALSNNEKEHEKYLQIFFEELKNLNIVPAGRVLYGAGSGSDVTFFNCFVMPFIKDSREGISVHRKEVMEIMSHGGGVGTNGTTLRPRGTIAKSVGGRSSGAVSWLNDLSTLTHLVEQGGSRRGAQMIMMADWHPDIIEFIISKMQNPKILRWLKDNSQDRLIREEASRKIKFVPLTNSERNLYEWAISKENEVDSKILQDAKIKLEEGGNWEVENPSFLSGANISVTISHKFMQAVENDDIWELKFPDLDKYTPEQKHFYDENWHKIGDIYEWEQMGYSLKTYYTMRARDLWDLINFCANYSAEPGIFFIDQANDMTNAKAYDMKVVATNPCGEQPLAPYSVCNLAAINLANFVNKETKEILYDKLQATVRNCTRLQDNVIYATPYFLEANKKQALGERRVGLGVMGLHDLLIYHGVRYGSLAGNKIVDKIFEVIATTAYRTSIELAKEKGSFPFLKDRERFINTGYMKKMPEDIRQDILKYGIRNSHLLTIAPTGSTGTMVGVSTGLEPYFGFKFYRSGRLGKNIEVNAKIVDEWLKYNPGYSADHLPDIFVSAMQLAPEEHADVQCIIQRWVDSSISKTVNAPRGYSVKDVEKIYTRLYHGGAKGGTVYVDGSRDSQVLSLTTDNEHPALEQLNLENLGVEVISNIDKNEIDNNLKEAVKLRGINQDRNVGTEVGDVCPICKEGTMIDAGGCVTCNNCNVQLKCGL